MYEEVYEAWKKERSEFGLQPLPKDFYDRMAEYTRKLKESQRMLDEKTLKARLSRRELENIRRLSKELTETRLNKILRIMSSEGRPITSALLTVREEHIFETLMDASTQFLKIAKNTYEGKELEALQAHSKEPQTILVRFMCEIPAIVGVDMKTYGPFKSEDVASLPAENAKALIHQKAAVEIELKKR